MNFNLFLGEQVIISSDNNTITLTNMRIRKELRSWGNSFNQSILLQHITSCEVKHKSNPIFLILSAISILASVYYYSQPYGESQGQIPLLFAAAFALIYFLDRRSYIVIGSPSTKMYIKVSGGRTSSLDFISSVEAAIVDLKK